MSKNDLRLTISSWVDGRVHDILSAPRMWGESLEAVEMQVLTLLQVRALAVDSKRELLQPRRILDRYVEILAERFGIRPAQPVHQICGENEARFVEVLTTLSKALSDHLEVQKDDFFARSYLGIELSFKPGQGVTAQTVTSFYENFRHATRALARSDARGTGRAGKTIEGETDFELDGVKITPHNGVPASARIVLGAPYGQHDIISREKVKDALGQMLDLGERAETGVAAKVEDFGSALEMKERVRAFVQTLRILPRGRVAEVKVGGAFVARPVPVRLREAHQSILVTAMSQYLEPSPYDQVAVIRAIDLDKGSFTHGRKITGQVQCYVHSDLVQDQLSRVGVTARVVGMRYRPREGRSFVMAETLEILSEHPLRPSRSYGGHPKTGFSE